VFEIVQDHYGDTYRAVYGVGFAGVVCRKRVRTSRTGMAIARSRKQRVEVSSGNVFADLGFPKAEERETKVRLAVAIQRSITALGLTQAAAARVLGTSQPKVSALVSARLEGFSVERLMNFLVALGNDVEIIVRKRRSTRSPGRIHVAEV
jgi:predicted XRE-type DNA-binding protein